MPSPDVVVVGAGVIGCGIAAELARRRARVRVLDPRGVGRGASRASGGMLTPYIEGHSNEALRALGARSLALFDGFVRQAVEDSGLGVDYARCGTLQVAMSDDQARVLAAAAGERDVEYLDRTAAREAEPGLGDGVAGALMDRRHGCVSAGQLVAALARAAAARGAAFVSDAGAVHAVSALDGGVSVRTEGERIDAGAVVLAAGSWSGQIDVAGLPALPVRPVRGQLVELTWRRAPLRRITWGPECYLVPWPGALLVGATSEEAGFDERATVAGVSDLLAAACDLVPGAWQAGFAEVRVGLRPATPDDLPIVGPSRRVPGLVYATGHYRNGILLAPLTAQLVAELIVSGRPDASIEVTKPWRFGEC
jgi:glycine oxidase